MMEKILKYKFMTLLAIIGVVYFFLEYLTPLFSPILVAMLFVTIFGPLLKKIQVHFHIHRQIGAIILLIIAGVIFTIIICIFFYWFVGSLPEWTTYLDTLEDTMQNIVRVSCQSIGNAVDMNDTYLEEIILNGLEEGIDYFQLQAVPGMLMQSLEYLKILVAFGGFLITFLIASVFLAKDYDRIMNNLLDKEEYHMLLEVICGVIKYIATFVKAQFIIITCIASTVSLVLFVLKIEQGILWGILAGLLDMLPFIGTGLVLVPLLLTQFIAGNYLNAMVIIILYVSCIFLREMLEPRLIGRKMGVSPVAVLLAVYAGIQLFGMWGIIKGPLGFMLIYQTFQSLYKGYDAKEVMSNKNKI